MKISLESTFDVFGLAIHCFSGEFEGMVDIRKVWICLSLTGKVELSQFVSEEQ